MEWERTHAEHLPVLLSAQRKGLKVAMLERRPQVPGHLVPVFQAYRDLIHDGAGGGVPFQAIATYCQIFGTSIPWMLDRIRAIERARDAQPRS